MRKATKICSIQSIADKRDEEFEPEVKRKLLTFLKVLTTNDLRKSNNRENRNLQSNIIIE